MEKDVIERKLKIELELFRIHALFIIALVAGNVNLLFRYLKDPVKTNAILISIGCIALLIVFIIFVRSYFMLYKLYKNK